MHSPNLKPTQYQAYDAITKLLKPDAETKKFGRLLIEAEGGSGKTYCIIEAVANALRNNEGQVALVAPTHIAKCKLLDEMQLHLTRQEVLDGMLSRVSAMTSARFAGRYLSEHLPTGDLHNGHLPFNSASQSWLLVVLDEVSITPSGDLARLLSGAYPVVLSGDSSQCQAVRQKPSPVFDSEYREEKGIAYLTISGNQRNDGTIRALATQCRDNTEFYPQTESDQNKIFANSQALLDDFIRTVLVYRAQGLNWGSDLCYMAFTNAKVRDAQLQLRSALFSDPYTNWQVGEYVRADALQDDRAPNGTVWQIIGAETELKRVKLEGCKFKLHTQRVRLANGNGLVIEADLLPFSERGAFDEAVAYYQAAGDDAKRQGAGELATAFWTTRSAIGKCFEQVSMACCITLIRSQSRTIDKVWIDTADIRRFGTNKGRLLYTGYSRAVSLLNTVATPNPIVPHARIFRWRCEEAGVPALTNLWYWRHIGKYGDEARAEREAGHINWHLANRRFTEGCTEVRQFSFIEA